MDPGTLIVVIVGWLALSFGAANLAESRGLDRTTYFLTSILLSPLVGLIMAATAHPKKPMIEKAQLAAGDEKKCLFCAELIKAEAIVCRYCGRDVAPTPSPLEIQPTPVATATAPGEPAFHSKAEYEAWKASKLSAPAR